MYIVFLIFSLYKTVVYVLYNDSEFIKILLLVFYHCLYKFEKLIVS